MLMSPKTWSFLTDVSVYCHPAVTPSYFNSALQWRVLTTFTLVSRINMYHSALIIPEFKSTFTWVLVLKFTWLICHIYLTVISALCHHIIVTKVFLLVEFLSYFSPAGNINRCHIVLILVQVHGEVTGGQPVGFSVSAAVCPECWRSNGGSRWRISFCSHCSSGMKNHFCITKKSSNFKYSHPCDTGFVLQGAALGAMVGQMTYGKRQFENLDEVMRRLIPPFHQAMNDLLLMVDADSSVFNSYMVSKTLQSRSRHRHAFVSLSRLMHRKVELRFELD